MREKTNFAPDRPVRRPLSGAHSHDVFFFGTTLGGTVLLETKKTHKPEGWEDGTVLVREIFIVLV